MSEQSGHRRQSYGPTSPSIGPRGTRTLERILEASLKVFASRGFHDATIQDIAAEVGTSRATLYQYFPSKEKIFVELLEECGAAVVDVVKNLGLLGPTPGGFANLRWWLSEWARVYDQYATLFVEWANIDTPAVPVGSLVAQFNTNFNKRVARRLRESGVTDVDVDDVAAILTGVILRFNYLRQMGSAPADVADERGYHFAVVIQLMLFPDSPPLATRGGREVPRRWYQQRVSGKYLANHIEAPTARYNERLAGLTAKSASTVHALIKSGAKIFADRGFQRANIDDIVTDAGFARGTFYKYFDGKIDLLMAIASMCTQDSVAVGRRLERISMDSTGAASLREWVGSTISLSEEYRGVYRVWMERSPTNAELSSMRGEVVETLRRSLFVLLGKVERGHPIDLRVSEIFVVSLLDQVPEAFQLNNLPRTRAHQIELVSVLLERALFGSFSVDSTSDGDAALAVAAP
ncbi:MAG: TetR/AcrR family transcriptional regulator [Subtercola sp.]|nr:TetR/AcrR family transcriptional regulator [Subtercola sp.]